MRIRIWLSMLLLLAGGEALAQPACHAGGPYSGVIGKPITFDGTESSSPGGTIVSYTWDFGDSTTGTGPTPEHTYHAFFNFFVTLTIVDSNQQSSSCQTSVYVGPDESTPLCDAGGPYYGLVNVPIEFDGSGSSNPGGFIVAYDWEFGDGSTGTGTKPPHTYSSPGAYTIILTVTDEDGAASSCASTAMAYDGEGFPHCDAGGPYTGATNQPIHFDGTGSNVPEGGHIMVYAWDFGDGTTGTGAIPEHAYANAASYTIALTVYDGALRQSTCTTYADISPLAVLPTTWGRIKSAYR